MLPLIRGDPLFFILLNASLPNQGSKFLPGQTSGLWKLNSRSCLASVQLSLDKDGKKRNGDEK